MHAFASWLGACCSDCGLPSLLHAADGCDERLLADALQGDSLTGTSSPASGARHAPSFTDGKEKY